MRWAFFIDANLEPRTAEILRKEGYRAEFSDYVLDEDADDEADILPYLNREELIIVTADIKNFAPLDESCTDSCVRNFVLPVTAGTDSEQGSLRVVRNFVLPVSQVQFERAVRFDGFQAHCCLPHEPRKFHASQSAASRPETAERTPFAPKLKARTPARPADSLSLDDRGWGGVTV